MMRREFLASTVGATVAASAALADSGQAAAPPAAELYELRKYIQRTGKNRALETYVREAWIPAAKRAGAGPIGCFNVMLGPDSPSLYLLITHQGVDSVANLENRILVDPELQRAGADFLKTPSSDPAYVRMESSLMAAFTGMAKLEVPAGAKENRPRIFELRTYESHSKTANKMKIEMFNVGEIAIFRRAGLNPVFFGETLIGPRMPNLTYMLVYDNLAARDAAWGRFGGDPEWHKLSTTPGYTDVETVSTISNVLLRPTGYSEI